MAKITVNGEPQDVALPVSILQLLKNNGVERPELVSVQLNGEFVGSDEHATVSANDGDTVDFLFFMGGGALPLISNLRTDVY
ncbi:MAG: sulfur carrier protein ThiS [Bacteroidales bacterium]|jgi:sulfur carrier protein|nr:sulfur carrier protein ThiS [Bacteroidales bacterium]